MDSFLEQFEYDDPKPSVEPSRRPQVLSDLDISTGVLEDLALKTLYISGSQSILDLGTKMGLGFNVANELCNRLRTAAHCQVTGMNNNIPQIAITSQGRSRAMELLGHNHYVGVAPISLDGYIEMVRRQSVTNVEVHPEDVERAFAHLVVDKEMLRQFGTTLNSGSAVFIYGPPGVGKTTYAETLSRVIAEDDVWIPHAIEIHGQIITVFDASIHQRSTRTKPTNHDERWVLCNRPRVMAGGELTIEMLDLQYNPVTKFYVSPLQVKANNGVLIIDDFGRQRVRPEELLNRWVVPLDRRIDFLTMAGGAKIEIPFEALVVFASNIDPQELVDPAFLRRIQTKIRIGALTPLQFHEIFRRVAEERKIGFDQNTPYILMDYIQNHMQEELRACQPGDIINQICWAARYERRTPFVDQSALFHAIASYFPAKQQP